jgi:hypothetical protein
MIGLTWPDPHGTFQRVRVWFQVNRDANEAGHD